MQAGFDARVREEGIVGITGDRGVAWSGEPGEPEDHPGTRLAQRTVFRVKSSEKLSLAF